MNFTSKIDENHLIGLYKSKLISNYEISYIQDIVKEIASIKIVLVELGNEILKDNLDLLLCIHDNDVLNVAREFTPYPPILAIELPGDNSFFAQITLKQLKTALLAFIEGRYILDVRSLLELKIDEKFYYSLNDVHITSSAINSRMRYDIRVNNESLFNEEDSANAILISTPTGSTAMSFNLGGVIIHPQASVFQILAVASRNPTTKNQILPDEKIIEIEIFESIMPLVINIDNLQIESSQKSFLLQKANKLLSFIKFYQVYDHMNTQTKLKSKLSFEDTQSLTSTAKFVLHVLQTENKTLTINELIEITHIQNQKTLRTSLNLLMEKGFIKRRENLNDLREHLYYYNPID